MYRVIPLTSDPNQTMDVSIPVDGKNLNLTLGVTYNGYGNYWCLTISKDGIVLIDGLPLLCSSYPAGDLLGQYRYLGLGSAYLIKNGSVLDDAPNASNLGSSFQLVWGDTVV
jgi:hypothetical protein